MRSRGPLVSAQAVTSLNLNDTSISANLCSPYATHYPWPLPVHSSVDHRD